VNRMEEGSPCGPVAAAPRRFCAPLAPWLLASQASTTAITRPGPAHQRASERTGLVALHKYLGTWVLRYLGSYAACCPIRASPTGEPELSEP
jgi:hypothetical protein